MKNISLYLVVLFLASCKIGQENSSDEKIVEIENQLEQFASKDGYSGTVLVAQNENVLFEKAYGFANLAHNVPNKTNTKFNAL